MQQYNKRDAFNFKAYKPKDESITHKDIAGILLMILLASVALYKYLTL